MPRYTDSFGDDPKKPNTVVDTTDNWKVVSSHSSEGAARREANTLNHAEIFKGTSKTRERKSPLRHGR